MRLIGGTGLAVPAAIEGEQVRVPGQNWDVPTAAIRLPEGPGRGLGRASTGLR